MTDIRFYHLQKQTLEDALPALLSKALQGGYRVVVKLADEKHVQTLNDHLWVYKPQSFLPHGTKEEGMAEDQPIWITVQDENPNGARALIAGGGAFPPDPGSFDLYCEMLDAHNTKAIEDARARWVAYKEAGHTLTYWQQNAAGGWEQKA